MGLDHPINAFDPPLARTRRTAAHQNFSGIRTTATITWTGFIRRARVTSTGYGTGDMSSSVSITAFPTIRFARTPLRWG